MNQTEKYGYYHATNEGGMDWNNPEIGIEWPELRGEYKGSASAEGYTLKDGTALKLSDKDQKWLGLKETFKFYNVTQSFLIKRLDLK